MQRLFLLKIAMATLVAQATFAGEPQPIDWERLVPDRFTDPFAKLSQEQLLDLAHFARIRELIASDKLKPGGEDAQEATTIEKRLRKDGLDIVWLMAQREHVRRMRRIEAMSVQTDLNGKEVQLAGYIIPLNRSGKLVTEFLLVPDAQMCSHAIPPPPNQAVLVHAPDGIASRGRNTAVQVSGRLETKQTARTIQTSGGPRKLTSAYLIAPEEVVVHSAAKRRVGP